MVVESPVGKRRIHGVECREAFLDEFLRIVL
jgi:hypothetical protein